MNKIIMTTPEELTQIIEDAVGKIQIPPDPVDGILRNDKELAEFLGVSKVTVWGLKKKGLPCFNSGRLYLYRKNEVLEWLRSLNERP
ncbi:MAG: helix-turn-helix domain-containing protein [Bacteroidales bacterium]|nr:helix-turn-helix domain-containing protein [Lentimicrobiaceae bacterium]MDD5694775.1 helix-turn-helix domain-containing protein [Bacteroidales bacterium]